MTTALSTGLRKVATRFAPDPTPDGELLSRFLTTRDESAFAALVRRHAGMVLGTCRRVLGNATDADDAFQAAFVVLVRKAHALTDRTCVGNYLYGVAFHTALKARAMATKRKAKEARASRERERPESVELTRILDEELANLPEKYREPVVLCELEGVSRKDAAGRLGIPEGTISSRLATAHRMLEKRLKARGFAVAGITAVLGSQAFAVSDSLTRAAVRAAASGGPAGVTQLAAEVTKMFLLNKLKVGTAVLAGVVLVVLGVGAGMAQRVAANDKPGLKAPVPANPGATKDEDRIQGLWQAESLEAGGQKAPDAAVEKFQVRFKGNTITFVADDRTHTFDLDASAKPKALNLTPGDGTDKGKKLECAIYDLDGDTLKICMDKEGQSGKRPTEFKTAPGDGLAFMVFKRVKEQVKNTDAKKLLGKWVQTKYTVTPPLKDVVAVPQYVWTFGETGLHTEATIRGERTAGNSQYVIDPTAKPKELTISGNGAVRLRCIYELDGDTLRVAMYGLAEQFRPTAFTVTDDTPKGVGDLTVIEFTREPKYALGDGEVLKLIPAPFLDEREAIYAKFDAAAGIKPTPPADDQLMAVTVDKDKGQPVGANAFTNRRTPGVDISGKPLSLFLEHGLRIDMAKVADPHGLLESTVLDADIVLKKGAAPADLLTALRKELKAKCGVDLVLEFRDAETQVVAISGKHTLNPTPFETSNSRILDQASTVHFYASDKQDHANSLGANTRAFPGELAKFLGRPVIDESDLKTNAVLVMMKFHEQHPATAKTRAEDRNPEKVLQNLANQTGLVFKLVKKQKVRALVVAKPDSDDEYSLKDGEALKLIPAPFPGTREAVFQRVNQRRSLAGEPKNYRMVIPVEGGSYLWQSGVATSGETGWPLWQAIEMILGVDRAECVAADSVLELPFNADTLVERGTSAEKRLPALQSELKAKCGIDVNLEFREFEREVVVASGSYQLRAGPNRVEPQHEYTLDTDEPKGNSNWTNSVFNQGFLPAIGKYIGRPVIDETNLKTLPTISFSLNEYEHKKPGDPKAKAPDPETVLKRLAGQTGLTFKLEKRTVRALVIEQTKKPDEPAWKTEFRKAYGLKDGQLVRRVAPPYPDCREEYFKDLYKSAKGGGGGIPFADWFAVLGWKTDWTTDRVGGFTMIVKPDEGVPLKRILDMALNFPASRVEADATTLGRKVTGDFVVRADADPEKLAGQLETLLRKELELPVKFSLRDAEEEVFVLSGKYESKPLDDRKADQVEVYAGYLTDRQTGGGGSGTVKEMAAHVERHVNKPIVVGKIEGEPKRMSWHFNVRQPMLRDPAKGIDTYAEDTNPAAVLENIARQTGLTVKAEKRKVRTLVVEHADIKK